MPQDFTQTNANERAARLSPGEAHHSRRGGVLIERGKVRGNKVRTRKRTTSEGAPATQHTPKRLDDSCSMGNGLSAVSRNLFLPVRACSQSQIPSPNPQWPFPTPGPTRGC